MPNSSKKFKKYQEIKPTTLQLNLASHKSVSNGDHQSSLRTFWTDSRHPCAISCRIFHELKRSAQKHPSSPCPGGQQGGSQPWIEIERSPPSGGRESYRSFKDVQRAVVFSCASATKPCMILTNMFHGCLYPRMTLMLADWGQHPTTKRLIGLQRSSWLWTRRSSSSWTTFKAADLIIKHGCRN